MPFRLIVTFVALMILPSATWAQTMYRCATAEGKMIFQDKPCAEGMKESTIDVQPRAATGPVKVLPSHGLSQAQRKDYENLMRQTYEVFRVLGRAQVCGQKIEKHMKELFDELRARHGLEADQDIGRIALIGLVSGAENRINEFEPKPREPTPCPVVAAELPSLALPRVPASLVLRASAPTEKTTYEQRSPTGQVRFVVRTPPDGKGPAKTIVLHGEKEIYETTNSIDFHRTVHGVTPVLLIATKDREGRCGEPPAYIDWYAITLPLTGASKATLLRKTNCLAPMEFQVPGATRVCFLNSSSSRFRSRIFSLDDDGVLHESGDRPPGVCPR